MLSRMFRKTLKVFAWVAGVVIGLVVAIYVAGVAVNWRDQPPSPAALQFVASYEDRPPLADSANAFVYLLGFDAPLNDDPHEVGARRLAWLRTSSEKSYNLADDPQTVHLAYLSTDRIVEELLEVCGDDSREC